MGTSTQLLLRENHPLLREREKEFQPFFSSLPIQQTNKLRMTWTQPQKTSPPPTLTSNPPTSKSKSLKARFPHSKGAANWWRRISRDLRRDSESPLRSWKRPPRQQMNLREVATCLRT